MADKKKVVAIVLRHYFETLMADGLLDKYTMAPNDYDYLAGRILDQIAIAEGQELEKEHEKSLANAD